MLKEELSVKKATNKVMAFGFFVIALLFLAAPQKALAAETADGFIYDVYVSETGEVSETIITGYSGLGGDIIIPETINDGVRTYTVTGIGNNAFANNSSLTSVTIPNSVTSIDFSAFANCTSLTSVTIPNSVISIGFGAFSSCTSLTSVTVPDSVTSMGDSAFYNCTNLTSVTISNSVTSIGDWTFLYCTNLTGVTIPDSVTSIGDLAFQQCTSLTGVMIPNSVISIGNQAFSNCTALTSIFIPSSVTSIGDFAFAASGLTDAKFLGYAPSISMGTDVFNVDYSNFKIYYFSEEQGFTNPWYGYPTELVSVESIVIALKDFVKESIENGNIRELGKSLVKKLENIYDALERGEKAAAIEQLNEFINAVSAQSGKKIDTGTANDLIAQANMIIARINEE